jgi:dipeptidyl aminopeptidase/acylaminoacyl peptidase
MKTSRTLFIAVLVLVIVTACGLEEEHEHLTPFDPADWPTPVPTQAAPTPTPFPKEALEILTNQNSEIVAAQTQSTPTPSPPPATPTSQPTSTPTPEVTGVVTSYALNVRKGPGSGYDILAEIDRGDEVTILSIDPTYGWANVQTANGVIGWVNPYYLDIRGDLELLEGNQPLQATAAGAIISGPGSGTAAGEKLLVQLRSGGDIMVVNRAGTGLRRLTSGIDPALSPDGRQVAFTRWDGATEGSLWVINIDGSGEQLVMGNIRQVKSPSWSPEGKRVAVNFQEGGTLQAVRHCHDVSEGEPDINFWQAYDVKTRVEFDEFGRPIVYVCWMMPPDAHWKLRIIDVETAEYKDMPAGLYVFGPAWDPANSWRVVSTAGQGLAWTDVNRGVADSLTTDSADRAPVFSPDGKYIAVTYRQDTHWDIHRLNADGTGRVRLTKTPLYNIVDSTRQWNNVAPTFSPDGSEIAFLTDRTGRWEVWVMNVDGANQRPMFPNAINDQLPIEYAGNDERSLQWGL